MIEGEAEILQSSNKPTVLHGRPGMTLKFVEPDGPSKTVIAELEKARLAMKPAPPSVPPRPSDVPAEPRPVVPALGGRIDAANALAECVVIGDPATLVDTAKADSKKFVVPSIPAVGAPRPNTPSSPPPMRAHSPSNPPPVGDATPRPKTPSVPPDPASKPLPAPVLGKPGHKPTSIGFPALDKTPAFPPKTQVPGAPQVENPLLNTKLGMEAPPNRTKAMEAQEPPPATPTENPLLQTKLGAPGSDRAVNNATTLGTALDKAPAARPVSEHDEATTIGESPPKAPPPPAAATGESPPKAAAAKTAAPVVVDEATTIGEKPTPPPKQARPPAASAAPTTDETTAVGLEPPAPPKKKTDPMPATTAATPNKSGPVPAATDKSGSLPVQNAAPTSGSGPVVATPGKPQHRATSIGFPVMGRTPFETQPVGVVRSPVVPDGATTKSGGAPAPRGKNPTRPPLTPRHPTPVAPVPIVRGPAKAAPLVEDAIVENAIDEEERTDLTEVPTPPSKSASMAAAAIDGSEKVDPLATTQVAAQRSGGMRASEIMAAIPSDDWTMSPDASGPTVLPKEAESAKATIESKIPPKGPPTGNWSIALDPETGWSEPVKLKSEPEPAPAAPTPAPASGGKKRKGTGVAGNPDKAVADEKGFMAVEWEEKPTGIGEAKIEIDSTLMEPLKPMPALDDEDDAAPGTSDGARSNPAIKYITPPAGLPAAVDTFAAPAGASPFAAQPAFQAAPPPDPNLLMTERVAPRPFTPPAGMPVVQQQRPFTPPAGLPAVPPGAMSASFSNPGMPQHPQLFSSSQSVSQPVADQPFNMMGFAQPGYPSAPAVATPDKRKKQTIIIAIGAILALAAGFVLVLVLAGGKDKKTTGQTKTGSGSAKIIDKGSNAVKTGSGSAETGSGSAEAAVGSNVGSGEGSSEDGRGSGSAVAAVETPVDAGVADDPKPAGGPCKVSIASTPPGADVYLDSKKLGATPLDTQLPCGIEAKLTLKKAKFINTAKSFTPVDGKGNKVVVKLAKTTFNVKVTSSPAGATITVGGRSMGVTPASIRLPAFEAAAIIVSKPGFKTDSKTVTPKNNNTSHHVILKKGR